jgi:thiamine-monophosphate kinase
VGAPERPPSPVQAVAVRRGPAAGGEAALLSRLAAALGTAAAGPGVERGIGDDAAVLAPPAAGRLVATVDMVVEGQHFRLDGPGASSAADVGWRALAVNLSDVAAMGARPLWALVSLGVPPGTPADRLEALYAGMAELAGPHGVAVVGGNLARVAGPLVVDVCLLGHAVRPLLRTGAQPGDRLLVTGCLGRAAAGRACAEAGLLASGGLPEAEAAELDAARRRPVPRVEAGLRLANLDPGLVRAACDVSDGLAADAWRLCAGGLGLVLWAEALPIPPAVHLAAQRLGKDPLDWALHGGEDYELAVAVAAAAAPAVAEALAEVGLGAQAVGEFTADGRLRLARRYGGRPRPLEPGGWDPFAAP